MEHLLKVSLVDGAGRYPFQFNMIPPPSIYDFKLKYPSPLHNSYLLFTPTIWNWHKSNSDAYPLSEGHLSILSSFPYAFADISTSSYDFGQSINDFSLVFIALLSSFLKPDQLVQ